LLITASLGVGCGTSQGAPIAEGTGGSAGAGAGGAGQGGASGTAAGLGGKGGSGGILITMAGQGGGAGDATAGPTCSTDLHQVLAPDGSVLTTCGPEEACSAAGCVPACDAFAEVASSVGCDFLAATPSVMSIYRPGCFAVFVANAWNKPATLHVARGDQTFDVSRIGRVVGAGSDAAAWAPIPTSGLAPDEVAVLFLSSDPAANSGDGTDTTCPIPPAVSDVGGAGVFVKALDAPKLMPAEQTGRALAFHVWTDTPVSVYGILPYGGARSVDPSASLLYPTPVWGTNYVAVVPPKMYDDEFTDQWAQILAREDGTTVELVPTSSLPAGTGVAAAPRGALATFTLDAGELIQWQDSGDMSGTVLLANHPIAFYGGESPLLRDSSQLECENGASDNAHQQIPPIRALGSEYVGAPFRSRIAIEESVPYRLVGMADGTVLSYDPPQPAAPSVLSLGESADFEASGPFRVKSQDAEHPFYVAQIMPGCGLGTPTGDEEFVNVIPAPQYLDRYVFFTDPTYATTNLVLVRRRTNTGFADVTVDCLGTVAGWQDVGVDDAYQVTNVDLVRDGAGVGSCSNGRHVASSDGPFGLVVWGLDNWASYAYPAGSGAASINAVYVEPVVK
jgi:hypothetical protein